MRSKRNIEKIISDRIKQRERRTLETVVERKFRISLDRERHRQTPTTLTDIERETQLLLILMELDME